MAEGTPAPVAKDPTLNVPESSLPGGDGEGVLSKEKAAELLAQKRHANAEAKAAKERAEAAEAKLKTFEDREKTELQLAKEEAAHAKAALEASNAQRAHLDLVNQALRAGAVDPEYVAWRAEKDKVTPDSEWFAALKTANPHLFPVSSPKTPALTTGGGGPAPSGNDKAAKIAECEAKLAREQDYQNRHFLQRELRKLKGV